MSLVSTVGNSAVQLLRDVSARNLTPETAGSNGSDIASLVIGQSVPASPAFGSAETAAKSKISDALFSTTTVSTTQMKVALYERTGDALGVLRSDFSSDTEYRTAIKDAFSQVKSRENGGQIIDALEKSLGLDKLGVSLETVINAMTNVGGDDDRTLDAALMRSTQDTPSTGGDHAAPVLQRDEIGVYQLC